VIILWNYYMYNSGNGRVNTLTITGTLVGNGYASKIDELLEMAFSIRSVLKLYK
jgi:hypothetical protein